MLYSRRSPADRRAELRKELTSGRLLRFPGAFSPLAARIIADQGWDGIYISGAAMSAELALPDIGLLTLTEVALRGRQIQRVTDLPALIDVDTGFGEVSSIARTIQEMEDAGVAGCHLEDQENPKRCGHLDNKVVVSARSMVQKIQAAVRARRDDSFLIIARTDARSVEGLDSAISRARQYASAGADMIFPEALTGRDEFARFRDSIDLPLLANMTEFGRSPLLDTAALEALGYNVVIYPVTALRLAMGAVESGLEAISRDGTQAALVPQMQTRERLYELIDYAAYQALDESLYHAGQTPGLPEVE